MGGWCVDARVGRMNRTQKRAGHAMCILIIMLGYGDDVICTLRGVISDRAVVIEALVEKTSSCGCGSHGYGLNGIGMRKGAQHKV